MAYLIPQGTYGYCFMTDENGFTSEAEFLFGDEMIFEQHDKILLSDIIQASDSIRNIGLHQQFHLFNNAEMGNMILAVPFDCLQEI